MTVETTVQDMFDKYPNMYSTREECFDHLFCVIGNGYEWKWGQLVYVDILDNTDEEEIRSWHEQDYSVEHSRAAQSKKNIEARRKHDAVFVRAGLMKTNAKHDWYPLSKKYSRLFQIPSDAKPDWKDAVEECKRMLERDGIDWKNAEE